MALKSEQKSVYVPGELVPVLEKRALEEGYPSLSGYFLYLAVYDLMLRRPHRVTVKLMEAPQEVRDKIIGQIIHDYESGGGVRPGSWLESRLTELVEEEMRRRTGPDGVK